MYKPASTVFMVRPIHFRYNEITAADNAFQQETDLTHSTIQSKAEQEFDAFVKTLRDHGVDVRVFQDSSTKDTPDSIFPNNWISTHMNETIILYPMFAENRRDEVNMNFVEQLKNDFGFTNVIDLTDYADKNQFLESTGSLVLDRVNKIAYCSVSERTNVELAEKWSVHTEYELVLFHAVDEDQIPIYHTNVLMAIGEHFAVICLDAISDLDERVDVISMLDETEKEIIEITFEQMNHFAGNMIELANQEGESLLVMSQAAYDSLDQQQRSKISAHSTIVTAPIPTIEKHGGGSVRCMIAEVFPATTSRV